MHWIEPVAEPPERLAVMTLSASVEPYRNQRQKCQSLSCKEICFASHRNLVGKSTEYLYIYIIHPCQLTEIMVPLAASKEVEYQNCKYACVIIVTEGYKSQ